MQYFTLFSCASYIRKECQGLFMLAVTLDNFSRHIIAENKLLCQNLHVRAGQGSMNGKCSHPPHWFSITRCLTLILLIGGDAGGFRREGVATDGVREWPRLLEVECASWTKKLTN